MSFKVLFSNFFFVIGTISRRSLAPTKTCQQLKVIATGSQTEEVECSRENEQDFCLQQKGGRGTLCDGSILQSAVLFFGVNVAGRLLTLQRPNRAIIYGENIVSHLKEAKLRQGRDLSYGFL